MTQKRLEELKQKFANNEGNLQDINEILTDLFLSFSQHMKEMKKQIADVQENQQIIYEKLDALENPIYSFIKTEELHDIDPE